MEMSSAPDIRRRPHQVRLAPGGERFGKNPTFFKRGKSTRRKKIYDSVVYGQKFVDHSDYPLGHRPIVGSFAKDAKLL
jgi:hypothetical protein